MGIDFEVTKTPEKTHVAKMQELEKERKEHEENLEKLKAIMDENKNKKLFDKRENLPIDIRQRSFNDLKRIKNERKILKFKYNKNNRKFNKKKFFKFNHY